MPCQVKYAMVKADCCAGTTQNQVVPALLLLQLFCCLHATCLLCTAHHRPVMLWSILRYLSAARAASAARVAVENKHP